MDDNAMVSSEAGLLMSPAHSDSVKDHREDADALASHVSLLQSKMHKSFKKTNALTDSRGAAYCAIMRSSCDVIFSTAADSEVDCSVDTAEADAVCEAMGAGPEDPLADACAAAFTGIIMTTCTEAVKAGESFGTSQCEDAVGCGCKSNSTASGSKCERGDNACCVGGSMACGRYDNHKEDFQCCSSYTVIGGVAWCSNAVGGACSKGEDDNCDAGYACGRYNSDKKDFQCCSVYQVISQVAWCANPVGGECSDGEDNNCLTNEGVCGVDSSSSSNYMCCNNYTVNDQIAYCA